MPPHSERCTGTGSSPRVLFSPHPETPRHAASARPIERLPYCIVYSKEHRKSHDSGWMVDGLPGTPPEGPVSSRRGRRPENASEGSVSLPEYASSVKDDRSGWKGGTPSEEGKNVLCRVSVFFVVPSGGGEAAQGGRSRSLKRIEAFRAVRAEEGNIFLPICCQRSV